MILLKSSYRVSNITALEEGKMEQGAGAKSSELRAQGKVLSDKVLRAKGNPEMD
jgi:hypothetical protein